MSWLSSRRTRQARETSPSVLTSSDSDLANRTVAEVRVGDQPKGGEADRRDDPAQCAGAGGQVI
jgi:hypothetical protein